MGTDLRFYIPTDSTSNINCIRCGAHPTVRWSMPMRSVVHKERVVVSRSNIRGFKDDFVGIKEDVILMEGEVHGGRPPGSLRFTTEQKRDDYTLLVLQDVVPPSNVYHLAKTLDKRMMDRTNGRVWMGAHMRLGDCE